MWSAGVGCRACAGMSWVLINFPEISSTCLLPPNPQAISKHKVLRSCHFFSVRFCFTPALIPSPSSHTHQDFALHLRLCHCGSSSWHLACAHVCVRVCQGSMSSLQRKVGITSKAIDALSFISADRHTAVCHFVLSR